MITISEKIANDMIDFITPTSLLPKESADSIVEINKAKLRKQLIGKQIYPDMLDELKSELKMNYFSSRMAAGESVGILAAQAIGEFQTQSTLNSFHHSGQNEQVVTVGVPRTNELLNVSKSQKVINCRIFLNKPVSNIKELRQIIGSNLTCLYLSDISERIDIIYDKPSNAWWKDIYKVFYDDDFEQYGNAAIRIKLKKSVIYKYRLTMKHISQHLEKMYGDIKCVFSSHKLATIDIYVNFENIVFNEEQILFITKENYKDIFLDECVIPTLKQIIICGIEGINNVYYIKPDGENGEWSIETDGCNFKQLLALDFVDSSRLRSNFIWDIYNNLGIEACRCFFIEEFMSIMDGINICHVRLLADRMTFLGIVSSITRYTLKKDQCGTLAKASFEESLDIFVKASFNCDRELTNGVSSSIICGKRSKIGTGYNDVRLDLEMIKNIGNVSSL